MYALHRGTVAELVSHEEVKQCFTPQLKGSTPAQCIHMISSQFLYFSLSELLIVFFSGNFGIYLSVISLMRDKRLRWLQPSDKCNATLLRETI